MALALPRPYLMWGSQSRILRPSAVASPDWWLASGIPSENIYDHFENLTAPQTTNYPSDAYISFVLAVQVDTWPTTGTPYLFYNGTSSSAWFSNPTPGSTELTFRIANSNYVFSTNVVAGDVLMMTYDYGSTTAYFYHNGTLLGTSGTANDNFVPSLFRWGSSSGGANPIGNLPKAFMANVFPSEQQRADLYVAMTA